MGCLPPGTLTGGPPAYLPAFNPYGAPAPFLPPAQSTWPQPPAPARQAAAPAPRPIVRAQAADEVAQRPQRPAPLIVPTPAELGVQLPPSREHEPGTCDWGTTRTRLQALGVDCFQLQTLSEGGFCFILMLPSGKAGQSHRIEARAATETEAVRLALGRAEELRSQAPDAPSQ